MMEVLIFFIVAVVIGLMFTFFGYPFFRILLPIWAFFAGLSFGFRGLSDLMGPGFISASLGIILGLTIGVVLAVLAYAVYSLAVYLFGLTVGYVLGSGLMLAMGFGSGVMTFMVGVTVALGMAWLFAKTKMPRFFIIFLTATGGAMATMSGIFVLFGKAPTLGPTLEITRYMVSSSLFWLLIWTVLAGFGIAFQYAVANLSQEDLNDPYNWEREYAEISKSSKKKK